MTHDMTIIGKTITALRKKHGMTQEALAETLNISAQSVSKWECGTTLPDVSLLPLIADCFDVTVDYLFTGETQTKGDFYDAVTERVAQKDYGDGYGEFLSVAGAAFFGIHGGNLRNLRKQYGVNGCDGICYHGDAGGLAGVHTVHNGSDSFLFGVSRDYFSVMPADVTAKQLAMLVGALSKPEHVQVLLAVIAMDDACENEIIEMTGLPEGTVSAALAALCASALLLPEQSKHKSLGVTYHVHDMHYPALVLLMLAANVDEVALRDGISCCLGKGDFPIGGLKRQ